MNSLTFSKADFPDLKDCTVGQEEKLNVTITPTAIDGDEVTADVSEITYDQDSETADSTGAATDQADTSMPASKSSGSKVPSAIVAIGIPGRGAKKY